MRNNVILTCGRTHCPECLRRTGGVLAVETLFH